MGVLTNTELMNIGDKLARWASMSVGDAAFDVSFNAGMEAANAAVISGSNSIAQYIMDTDSMDLTADCLPAARNLDESNPVPPTRFLFGIAGISAMISALNSHLSRYTSYTTLDAYLSYLNASAPTLRFHQSFHDHLKALSRANVFIGVDQVLATFTTTGAATGTFLKVSTVGTSYAGAQLMVKNQGAVTTGATLSVTGKKIDGTSATLTVTVAVGSDNAEQALSITTKLFVEVTGITISGGTNGNIYEIVAKSDRSILAA